MVTFWALNGAFIRMAKSPRWIPPGEAMGYQSHIYRQFTTIGSVPVNMTGRRVGGSNAKDEAYPVTPRLSLSCLMHAGNTTDLVQKMSPPVVKQAAYGETRTAIIKKKLMKNNLSGEAMRTEFWLGGRTKPLLPALRFILPPVQSLSLRAFCSCRAGIRRHEFHVGPHTANLRARLACRRRTDSPCPPPQSRATSLIFADTNTDSVATGRLPRHCQA